MCEHLGQEVFVLNHQAQPGTEHKQQYHYKDHAVHETHVCEPFHRKGLDVKSDISAIAITGNSNALADHMPIDHANSISSTDTSSTNLNSPFSMSFTICVLITKVQECHAM